MVDQCNWTGDSLSGPGAVPCLRLAGKVRIHPNERTREDTMSRDRRRPSGTRIPGSPALCLNAPPVKPSSAYRTTLPGVYAEDLPGTVTPFAIQESTIQREPATNRNQTTLNQQACDTKSHLR